MRGFAEGVGVFNPHKYLDSVELGIVDQTSNNSVLKVVDKVAA